MSPRTLARAERERLCDTALAVGADAPTLCGDWTVTDLLAHLLVRERDPIAASGIVVPPLGGLTDRAMRRTAAQGLDKMASRFRSPGIIPARVEVVERVANTLEFYVHHEDIRRAQPDWEPRPLERLEQDQIWAALKVMGRGLVRRSGVPVDLHRTDTGVGATLRRGADPVTVSGLPGELALFLYGRDQHVGLSFDGPPRSVERLRSAQLGL